MMAVPGGELLSGTRMAAFVFCDLVGSTALQARLGDDAADPVRRSVHGVLREAVRGSGGQEVKNLGAARCMPHFRSHGRTIAMRIWITRRRFPPWAAPLITWLPTCIAVIVVPCVTSRTDGADVMLQALV